MKDWILNLFGIETMENQILRVERLLGYTSHTFSQDKTWKWNE